MNENVNFRVMRKTRKGASRTVKDEIDCTVNYNSTLRDATLVIELTASCNAKCPGCFPQYLDLPQGFADDDFVHQTILDYANSGGQVVCFTARNEPLLDKRIVHYVKYAKELGINYVEFTSNAQLLNDTTARALIESGLDTIRFR